MDVRTLVIGDIHHHIDQVDSLLERHLERYDQIVFLGDYFDEYRDGPEIMQATCLWLLESVRHSNRIHLLGNHDIGYLLPDEPRARCPGYSVEKQIVFDRFRADLPITAFAPAIAIGPWLLTHAGVTSERASSLSAPAVAQLLAREYANVQAGTNSWLLDVSRARGGIAESGGPLWLDWVREFRPVPGLNQIVGHTPSRGAARAKCLTNEGHHRAFEVVEPSPWPRLRQLPQIGAEWLSINWCLDSGQVFAGLLDNGQLDLLV